MSKADELKAKNENLFERNTILLNENERLKKENSELRNNGFTVSAMTEQQLKVAIEKGEQLEKENADLRDNYDQFKAVAVPEIERLQKENAELKHNKKTIVHLADCLEEKMKERIEELETRCNELFLQNNEFAERFAKSTEIIKGLLSCCRNYPQENAEKMKQAEQFIKEREK